MSDPRTRGLRIAAWAVAVAIAVQTVRLFIPMASQTASRPTTSAKSVVPAYDYSRWRSLPVQMGRTKPMETACSELVREITGKTRFERQDPISVVLAWMLTGGAGAPGQVDWENYSFILCEHAELRGEVYSHQGGQAPPGRFVSPHDLRQSPGFDALLERVAKARSEHQEKAHQYLSIAELKAEEAARRLARYDSICGRSSTRLKVNAMIGEQYINLREMGMLAGPAAEQTIGKATQRQVRDHNPIRLAALDHSPGTGWFSLAYVRTLVADPKRWTAIIQDRIASAPRDYLAGDDLNEFNRFRDAVHNGQGGAIVEELRQLMSQRRERRLAEWDNAHKTRPSDEAQRLFYQIVRTPQDQERIKRVSDEARRANATAVELQQAILGELRLILAERDDGKLKRLEQGIKHLRSGSNFDAVELQTLALEYIEARTPDVYRRSAMAQEFPEDEARKVLDSFNRLREAYGSGDGARFDDSSREFTDTLREVAIQAGQPYPGVETIPLELAFNRLQPFRWAWVAMLLAAVAFAVRLGLGSRIAYLGGFLLAAISLALQVFGFYSRVTISGWAPVSNLYETIIFAAFMTGVFALVLEAIYHKTVIVLTGSLVATLGLILADNLPLDSGIGGLVPVLRSNFWLTIHVLTIICGYAAGMLAWGMGNVTLGLLAFGRRDRDPLKLLSGFTYRAMQLTVLLLAAGTFLGGWWAADAWGRFWGWDPKEVGALVALVCYVIPLHARYIGWVRDFGLAVCAVLCFGSILISWYVINFVLAAGLHSYGFGDGGGPWVFWALLLNLEWLLVASRRYLSKRPTPIHQESPD